MSQATTPSAVAGTESPTRTATPAEPSTGVKAAGYTTAAWCLGFAAVSVWEIVAGPGEDNRFAAYASALAAMGALVLVLKVAGAALALAAIRPNHLRLPVPVLSVALWGAFGLLTLYSAGNVVITVGTVSGLLEPSAAWIAAGGVTPLAVLYVLFFMAGAAMFGVLTISFHRRQRARWTPVVLGLLGAPVVLGLVLVVAPAILRLLGLLPA